MTNKSAVKQPKCTAYQYGKLERRTTGGTKTVKLADHEGILSNNKLDHFESRLPGQNNNLQ